MKRVAILFCGRVKTWQHCFDRFNNHILRPLHDAGYVYDGFLSHTSEELDEDTKQFIEKYNIVSYASVIPDISGITIPLDLNKNSKRLSFIMYYHWKNTFHLAEVYANTHNIRYDLVIYMRADQHFSSDLIIPDSINESIIYIPHGNDWTGLNDQFAMGSFKQMKQFTSIYDNLDYIYSKTNIGFHTETYVKLHTELQNIHIQRFSLDYVLHNGRQDHDIDNRLKEL